MGAEWILLPFFVVALAVAAGIAWRLRDWRVLSFALLLLVIELSEFDELLGAVLTVVA